jgi:hypothetical protein
MTNKRRAKRIIEKDENSFSKNNEEDKLNTDRSNNCKRYYE